MLISDTHTFAFVHIPKSAGTTVRYTLADYDERKARYVEQARRDHPDLGPLDFAHLPLALVKQLYSDDFALLRSYTSFALIRDPMARFASSLHEHLHWNTGETLSDMTPNQRTQVAARVIAKLRAQPEDTPITDPALIHFSRQCDYVELDGARVVSNIYPTERMDDMLVAIGALIGARVKAASKNRRVAYSTPALKSASEAGQRALRRVLPDNVANPLFRSTRRAMEAVGLVGSPTKTQDKTLLDPETRDFIERFYERDFALRNQLIQPQETPA